MVCRTGDFWSGLFMGLVLSWLIMVAVEKFVEHEKAEAFFQSLLIPPQTAPADRFR